MDESPTEPESLLSVYEKLVAAQSGEIQILTEIRESLEKQVSVVEREREVWIKTIEYLIASGFAVEAQKQVEIMLLEHQMRQSNSEEGK